MQFDESITHLYISDPCKENSKLNWRCFLMDVEFFVSFLAMLIGTQRHYRRTRTFGQLGGRGFSDRLKICAP